MSTPTVDPVGRGHDVRVVRR